MITLFLIDGHPSMRTVLRLRLELEADFVVIGESGHDHGAADRVIRLSPDVVILDAILPIIENEPDLELIRAFTRTSAVIVLSLYDDSVTRSLCLAAGATDVVSKHGSDEELLAVIRSAAT